MCLQLRRDPTKEVRMAKTVGELMTRDPVLLEPTATVKDAGEAEAAVRALRSAHFESARLGIVHAGDAHVPRFGWYAFIGSVAGTVGGALLGLLAGVLLAGVLPGWSAALSGGWFAVLMLALGGAATGVVAGLLISQSIARQGSLYYEEEASAG